MAGLNELPRAGSWEFETCSRPSTATLCGNDWTYTYFDPQITTSITVCTRVQDRLANENNLSFSQGSGRTTFKLTDPRIFVDLKDSVLEQPPIVCTVNNGPWSARIEQERACIGTCSPRNTLTVVGVPKSILFVWFGAFDAHRPGFEFVELPVKTGEDDLGDCHAGPAGAQWSPRQRSCTYSKS